MQSFYPMVYAWTLDLVTSLPSDKEPMQSMSGFLPGVGISVPIANSMSFLLKYVSTQ